MAMTHVFLSTITIPAILKSPFCTLPFVQEGLTINSIEQWFSSLVQEPAASASPWNLLEMQILGPHFRRMESETLRVGPGLAFPEAHQPLTLRTIGLSLKAHTVQPACMSSFLKPRWYTAKVFYSRWGKRLFTWDLNRNKIGSLATCPNWCAATPLRTSHASPNSIFPGPWTHQTIAASRFCHQYLLCLECTSLWPLPFPRPLLQRPILRKVFLTMLPKFLLPIPITWVSYFHFIFLLTIL